MVFMGPGETSRHTAFSVFGWRTPVYSRDGNSGVGTTGNVVKMRLAASSSMATEVNSPSPGEVQRTDPSPHISPIGPEKAALSGIKRFEINV